MQKWNVELVFTTDLLGGSPKNKEVYAAFIGSKIAKRQNPIDGGFEAEVQTVQEVEEKGWTGFHSDEQGIFLYDYQIKGFLKEAANTLKEGLKEKNLRSKVDSYVFVEQRKIRVNRSATSLETLLEPDGILERPLRCMTMQGPRVSLQRSDMIRAGRAISFTILALDVTPMKDLDSMLVHILDYGALKGLLQWRNGGYGRFSYTIKKVHA